LLASDSLLALHLNISPAKSTGVEMYMTAVEIRMISRNTGHNNSVPFVHVYVTTYWKPVLCRLINHCYATSTYVLRWKVTQTSV